MGGGGGGILNKMVPGYKDILWNRLPREVCSEIEVSIICSLVTKSTHIATTHWLRAFPL